MVNTLPLKSIPLWRYSFFMTKNKNPQPLAYEENGMKIEFYLTMSMRLSCQTEVSEIKGTFTFK